MFRFESPTYLYILLLIPALIAVFFYLERLRRRNLNRFGEKALVQKLMPESSGRRRYMKFFLLMLAVGLAAVMLARPQFGAQQKKERREGIEMVIALDISNSMLAQDVKPSRLERAKRLVSRLVDRLKDNKVGLIVFAGDAFTQLPITADRISAKMFLESIQPGLISKQGTDIGQAVKLAMRSFTSQEGVGRSIVIITDGEGHEPGAIEAVKEAAKKGIQINVLGVGSLEGSPIPLPRGNDFLKDTSGQVVITKLNREMGEQIAQAGGGIFAVMDNGSDSLGALLKEIDRKEKKELETTVFTAYSEQFTLFAWLLVIVLTAEFFFLERRSPFLKRLNLFKKRV